VQLAFELAATGDYTMERIADVLNERGLRMRPWGERHPAGPISAKYLARVLRDRYYLGFITYKGEEYQGRHEPLVSAELFAKVQAVLDERLPKQGSRQRRHSHYLKGHLWCGRCHDNGVESRLLLNKAKGHGGEYWYFFCSARQDHDCDAPYIRIETRKPECCGTTRACDCRTASLRGCGRCWRRHLPTRNAVSG
jgi:site-specific DNA recombinase